MKLSELKHIVDILMEHHGEWEIVIHVSDGAIPAPGTVKAVSMSPGFDWSHGKITIEPEIPLIRKPKKKP